LSSSNLKKIVSTLLVLVEIILLFTSSWGHQAFDGVKTDEIGFPFEWGPAIICSFVILIYIWRGKDHPLASFLLIGSLLLFSIRAKIFGVSGVDNLKSYGDVAVELSPSYWLMFVLAIVMFIVDIIFARISNSNSKD
jgi:hypothetical protein